MDLDHIIFSTNFKIWFRKFKQTPSERKKYDWDKVVQKPVIRLQYQLELKNRFDALNEVEGPDTLDKKIVKIVGVTTQKLIATHRNVDPISWFLMQP